MYHLYRGQSPTDCIYQDRSKSAELPGKSQNVNNDIDTDRLQLFVLLLLLQDQSTWILSLCNQNNIMAQALHKHLLQLCDFQQWHIFTAAVSVDLKYLRFWIFINSTPNCLSTPFMVISPFHNGRSRPLYLLKLKGYVFKK